mmetsp:Transcript_15937/g.41210  ORF Transcript_15937/g.41210 Transcript_15937/m.41210 type:complete len:246 (-) Transcript_15937:9-746(-)
MLRAAQAAADAARSLGQPVFRPVWQLRVVTRPAAILLLVLLMGPELQHVVILRVWASASCRCSGPAPGRQPAQVACHRHAGPCSHGLSLRRRSGWVLKRLWHSRLGWWGRRERCCGAASLGGRSWPHYAAQPRRGPPGTCAGDHAGQAEGRLATPPRCPLGPVGPWEHLRWCCRLRAASVRMLPVAVERANTLELLVRTGRGVHGLVQVSEIQRRQPKSCLRLRHHGSSVAAFPLREGAGNTRSP